MGFGPWQYDATLGARDWVYERLAAEGDIISHHLEEGVPWPEMLAGEDLPGTFKAELADRRDRRVPGQEVLVQINPMDIGRSGLAAYRGSSPVMPLPAPSDTYTFETPEVHQAFLTYARRIVDELQPDYLLIGVEVNLLTRSNPALWPGYAALHQEVYAALKAEHPDLPIGVSVFCIPYFPEYSGEDDLDAQLAGLADLEPHVDTVAFSLHPFMSALLADTFPDDYFDRLFALTRKPSPSRRAATPRRSSRSRSPDRRRARVPRVPGEAGPLPPAHDSRLGGPARGVHHLVHRAGLRRPVERPARQVEPRAGLARHGAVRRGRRRAARARHLAGPLRPLTPRLRALVRRCAT
ncbi:hypothetical protein ACMHYB_22470 [Sorangium sp. So ce1128]